MRECKTERALLRIETAGEPLGAVLRCAGEIDLSNLDLLEHALASSMANGGAMVEVDLGGVDYLDSCTLLALLHAHRELAAAGRTLRVKANPWALRLFRLLRLDALMEVRPA